jgi:hypothetical protein
MREYRKRKRLGKTGAPAIRIPQVPAPEPSRVSRKTTESSGPNPRLRTPGSRESVPAAAFKPRWTWRERFLSGYWHGRYACIVIAGMPVLL